MPSGANKKTPGGGGKGKKQQDSKKQALANNQKDDKVKQPGDEDINSGFGEYMRSSQAAEMMKLFVIANTLVVFLTMAWPQMKHSFEIIQSLIYGDEDGEF
ncbi:uncharacterized protein Xport-A [Ochlerotatus camptorhynchus]|uniref:uncharacterized protein Xport-A n=1 Tax=Ochlerotatus camptorhynchus TaxID=644619 RepID=UPI0031CEAA1A